MTELDKRRKTKAQGAVTITPISEPAQQELAPEAMGEDPTMPAEPAKTEEPASEDESISELQKLNEELKASDN